MPMTPPTPGLHRIHNGSKSPQRVDLQVGPYDELEVSEEVAAQLHAASGAFKDGPAPEWPEEWNPPAEAPAEPVKKPARKTAAKRTAAKKTAAKKA